MSMATPLGVLAVDSAAAITEVEDVNGGPLGVLAAGPTAATTEGDVTPRVTETLIKVINK
jgi:hypothetical protein